MENFFFQMIIAATPLLLAAIGELVTERSGVLNLGVEGMMLMGAVSAFAVANSTGSSTLGIVAGAGAGLLMALIFCVIALSLLANQAATGLALTIFGIGASGLIGQGFVGVALEPLAKLSVPFLSDATMLGRILLGHDVMVYLALALAAGVAWFLYSTRGGLALRAVGDNHDSGHALGYNVIGIRYLATMFGGACAGLGGAYLSLAYTPMWAENMTAGRGWIALALVVFATWRPWRVVAGAYLFAAVTQLQFYGQDWGLPVASQFLAMAPYVATILALVIISRDVNLTKANAPACIGRPFRAER
ncbi:MAG: ABC transporter permease [Paracoccaceae bacterium]|nr:ABC transporter permease [Paracoccaceae bacterium]